MISRNGATTIHRAYGVPVGFCGPTSRGGKVSPHFLKRKRRLQAAKLHVIDEFSMMGKSLLGKIDFRNQECLEREDVPWESFGGADAMLSGDCKQAPSLQGAPLYIVGPYTGTGMNKPKNKPAPPGTPSLADLYARGELLREEFQDVVILQNVHRIEKEASGMDAVEAAQYEADADRFLRLTAGLADCVWTPEDYAWLRNWSVFLLTRPESKLLCCRIRCRLQESAPGSPIGLPILFCDC